VQSQVVGPAMEVPGVDYAERIVNDLAESGFAGEAIYLRLTVEAGELSPVVSTLGDAFSNVSAATGSVPSGGGL